MLPVKILAAGLVLGAGLLTLAASPSPVERQLTSSPGTLNVIAEGDSITAGYTPTDRNNWPMRLRSRLCSDDCQAVTNDGQGGTCLVAAGCGKPGTLLVDRWQTEVLDQHPSTVVIMIGSNDLWFPNTSVQQIADGLKRLVFSALDHGINPVVLTITPFCTNSGPYGFLEPRREAVNNWLKSYFGAGLPGSVVQDVAASLQVPWGVQLDPHYHVTGCDGTDAQHLNPWGKLIVSDAIDISRIQ